MKDSRPDVPNDVLAIYLTVRMFSVFGSRMSALVSAGASVLRFRASLFRLLAAAAFACGSWRRPGSDGIKRET